MTTIYLHIGTPKTGTSSIQVFLNKNRAVLKMQDVVFPDFDLRYPTIRKERNGHFLVDKSEDAEKNYEIATEKLKSLIGKHEKIILTDESLWNNGQRIRQFAEDMRSIGAGLKILVYLRRQDLYLQSQWAQDVKEKMKQDFYSFTKKTKVLLDYYKQLCVLSEIVGKENVIVRIYEKQQFIEGDLLQDFFDAVGMKLTSSFKNPDVMKNPSLSGVYLETKRFLNRNPAFAVRGSFVVPYLFAVAEKQGNKTSFSENKYFTYEQQMEFLAKYEESNKKIAEEFLGREDGILFRDEILEKESRQDVFSMEDYNNVLAEVILLLNEKVEAQAETIKELEALKKGRINGIGLIRTVARKLNRTLKG